jgi:hypothetical protein
MRQAVEKLEIQSEWLAAAGSGAHRPEREVALDVDDLAQCR